ncbi:hypothetical protein SLA2020_507380 [Shorea laevis]
MDQYPRDADDLSDIKQAILRSYVNEDDDESDSSDTSDVEEFCEELKGQETKPGQKSDASSEEVDEDLGHALRIIFGEEPLFPIPPNVVSAMKGSREKQGILPKKLTVTWAPDVYDPVPTKVLPARGKKQQIKSKKKSNENKKKNGKKGKKGSNSSRCVGGGSSCDKKQPRRVGVSFSRCYKSLDAHDTLVNSPDGIEDFKVGRPDPHCGSSFLKNSHTKMHYPVAEAL